MIASAVKQTGSTEDRNLIGQNEILAEPLDGSVGPEIELSDLSSPALFEVVAGGRSKRRGQLSEPVTRRVPKLGTVRDLSTSLSPVKAGFTATEVLISKPDCSNEKKAATGPVAQFAKTIAPAGVALISAAYAAHEGWGLLIGAGVVVAAAFFSTGYGARLLSKAGRALKRLVPGTR